MRTLCVFSLLSVIFLVPVTSNPTRGRHQWGLARHFFESTPHARAFGDFEESPEFQPQEQEAYSLISGIQNRKLDSLFDPETYMSVDMVNPCDIHVPSEPIDDFDGVALDDVTLDGVVEDDDSLACTQTLTLNLNHNSKNLPLGLTLPSFKEYMKRGIKMILKKKLVKLISYLANGDLNQQLKKINIDNHGPFQDRTRVIETIWRSRRARVAVRLQAWKASTGREIQNVVKQPGVSPTGSTYGTSFIVNSRDYLPNIYTTTDNLGIGGLIVRHGVVDTPTRAQQYAALLKEVTAPGRTKRVLNLSLMQGSCPSVLSKKFNCKENDMLRAHNSNLQPGGAVSGEGIEIATINMNANIGIYKFMEQGSYDLSQTGYIQLADWLNKELQLYQCQQNNAIMTDFNVLKKIQCLHHKAGPELTRLNNAVSKKDTNPSTWWVDHNIGAILEGITSALAQCSNPAVLNEYSGEEDEKHCGTPSLRHGNDKFALSTLQLYRAAGALSQLNKPVKALRDRPISFLERAVTPVDRIRQFLLVSYYVNAMGITLTINCKSGIDRTGYVFSVVAAHRLVESGWSPKLSNAFFDLVMSSKNFDETFVEARKAVESSLYTQVREFWNAVMVVQFNVGYHIVFMSTGVPGFKYGKYKKRGLLGNYNPMPPVIFPTTVRIAETLSRTELTVVEKNDFTPTFFDILTDSSSLRKS